MAILGGVVYWGHDYCSERVELGVSDLAGCLDAAAVAAGPTAEFGAGCVAGGGHLKVSHVMLCHVV